MARQLPAKQGALLNGLLSVVLSGSLLVVGACSQPASPVPIWGGFDYSWERLSHRVSFLQSTVGQASPDGSFTLEQGMIGGPWSMSSALPEVVHFRSPWWWVQSSSLQAHHDAIDLTIGPTGLAREDVVISLESVGLDKTDVVTGALAGLRWDMDVPQHPEFPSEYDPAEGWTPQAFGAGIDAITLDDGNLSFSLWLQFRAGPLDREDMNEALDYLSIGASLSYVVLSADGAYSEAHVEASAWYPIDPPHSDIPEMDPSQRAAVISGTPGLPVAVPLLRSWQFVLNRELDEEGRYLRALAMAVDSFDYSADTGEARVGLDAYCSHSSVLEEGELQVEFTADVGLLQLESPSSSLLSGEVAGSADVGPFTELVVP